MGLLYLLPLPLTPGNAFFYKLRVLCFTQLLHVSALLSYHLHGANTNISLITYSNKMGQNKHTYVVVSIVQNFIGPGV
jgi:hypothetical protein